MDCSPPGSSVHGILQARTLEWVAISFSNSGIMEDLFSQKASRWPLTPMSAPEDHEGRAAGSGSGPLPRVSTSPTCPHAKGLVSLSLTLRSVLISSYSLVYSALLKACVYG